jgi:hypothetical protein
MGTNHKEHNKMEQAKDDKRPMNEIQASDETIEQHPNHYGLRFLSYGIPWVAWLLNVSIVATCHFQEATLTLCSDDTSNPDTVCVDRNLSLGVVRSSETTSSDNLWSMEALLDDLVSEDYYTNIALGSAMVPVALGMVLVCACCGPVLLGEFEQGREVLWTLASLVHLANAVFSALALIALKTTLCQMEICAIVETEEKYYSFANSNESENWNCQDECTPGVGVYLSIAASALWMAACLGTIFLKKSHRIEKEP